MARDRTRAIKDPSEPPKQWPNGSGFFREGTAHLKSDKGLLGRTVRRDNKTAAWRYMGYKQYKYLGEFPDTLAAMRAIKNR